MLEWKCKGCSWRRYSSAEFWSASGACAFVLKSSRPSLPLKKAPPLTPTLSPQERGRKPPYPVLEPLRYKVGGPSEVSPDYAGWDRLGWNGDRRVFDAWRMTFLLYLSLLQLLITIETYGFHHKA